MRTLSLYRSTCLTIAVAALATGCRASDSTEPTRTIVPVESVEQLYAAVNNPANAGSAISLAAGQYVLSVNDASGAARPNGGRVELQRDMAVYGVKDDRTAVTID